jgi:hypothetical protein
MCIHMENDAHNHKPIIQLLPFVVTNTDSTSNGHTAVYQGTLTTGAK